MPSKLPRIKLTVPLDLYAEIVRIAARQRVPEATLVIQMIDQFLLLKQKELEVFTPIVLPEGVQRKSNYFETKSTLPEEEPNISQSSLDRKNR